MEYMFVSCRKSYKISHDIYVYRQLIMYLSKSEMNQCQGKICGCFFFGEKARVFGAREYSDLHSSGSGQKTLTLSMTHDSRALKSWMSWIRASIIPFQTLCRNRHSVLNRKKQREAENHCGSKRELIRYGFVLFLNGTEVTVRWMKHAGVHENDERFLVIASNSWSSVWSTSGKKVSVKPLHSCEWN